MFNMTFTSVRALRDWLDKKRCECEGPEEYDEWLQGFFDRGNTVPSVAKNMIIGPAGNCCKEG